MSKDLERSIKDRVREIAKAEQRTFNDVWKTLVLERFLARLARSPQIENLVFKGGMLLSKYIPLGRETVDLDFLAVNLAATTEAIRATIENILNIPLEDGFSFTGLEVEQFPQPHRNYPGYGVKAVAVLGGTRTAISVDIGIGDVVEAADKSIEFLALKQKPLFEEAVALKVYPLEYIFAEKLETVIYRGAVNSRMKDFFDLWLLIQQGDLVPDRARNAVAATFSNRQTRLQLILPLVGQQSLISRDWGAFVRGLKAPSERDIPADPQELCRTIDRWLKSNELVGNE